MEQKRKKRVSTRKSEGLEINELLNEALKGGVSLISMGLGMAENMAHKRDLFKDYPYLNQAFTNVKTVFGFFENFIKSQSPGKAKTHERSKRTGRKKGHKKVSKSKTLRHKR